MHAAVITAFDQPPQYGELADPVATGPDELLVEVLAAGLHHITRGRASGTHYSNAGTLPMVAGIDGVGRGADGALRYFVQGPGQIGSMADKTVIDIGHSIELPPDSDPVTVAGAMNPAMASWLALRCRVPFQRGQKVAVLGATGSSGRMALQIARHLGASQVIAAGRDERRLAALTALGATDTVTLEDARLGALASDVDVVLDFIWGERVPHRMEAMLRHRADRSRPLTWIHVGSMAGDVAPIPGALLRSARLQIMGSGHGAVSGRDILTELPALVREIVRGTFQIEIKTMPLSRVAQAWAEAAHSRERIVVTP